MRDLCLKTATSVDLKSEGQNLTIRAHTSGQEHRRKMSVDSMTSRYSHTPHRHSATLRSITNGTLSPRDHYRTVQQCQASPEHFTSLHVPTRRENFNSKASVKLGNDPFPEQGSTDKMSDHKYQNVSRYQANPPDTLDVTHPAKAQVYVEKNRETLQRTAQSNLSHYSGAENESQRKLYQHQKQNHYNANFKLGFEKTMKNISSKIVDQNPDLPLNMQIMKDC